MRVIGYARVSTTEQARVGHSLAAQRQAIETEAARRGWELVEVIADDGYSGRRDDRPGLQRALTMLRKRNGPSAIVVIRMDRLARSLKHLCEFIDLSAKQRWGIVAMDLGFDTTTPNGRLVARIMGAVAEWESEVNGDRVREGMAEARAQARANGQPIRFGYQRATPDQVVALVISRRKRGWSYNRIAARLDKDKVPTPRGSARWYPSTVARIHNATAKET